MIPPHILNIEGIRLIEQPRLLPGDPLHLFPEANQDTFEIHLYTPLITFNMIS